MALLMTLLLSFAFVACQKSSPNAQFNNDTNSETGSDVTSDVDSEADGPRIVSCAPNLTELMYRLDAGAMLVGRSDYCDYPQEVSSVESVGTIYSPDIEKIVELKPDFVLTSTHFDEENAKKLSDLGVNVVSLYDENNVEGVYTMIMTLGEKIDRISQATECVDEMKKQISTVSEKIAGLDAPKVYYVIGYGEGGDYTAGGDTFIHGLIELAGGDNIAKNVSGWNITFEEIIQGDPDIIVLPEEEKTAFMESKQYKNLRAVQEGKVYGVDRNLFERQGYRNAAAVEELAKIFYPEAF